MTKKNSCGSEYKGGYPCQLVEAHSLHFFTYPFEGGTAALKWNTAGQVISHQWAQKQPDGSMKFRDLS